MTRLPNRQGVSVARESIPYTSHLGFSQLFCDFILHPERLDDFFDTLPIVDRADRVAGEAAYRSHATDLIICQNKAWHAPESVMHSLDRLNDADAVAVFVGQQACLFGGPYLILLKALAAVKTARDFEKRLNVPVVPIFWIAADDHDFAEISFVDMFNKQGEPTRLKIDTDDSRRYPPIGALAYDDSITRELDRLASLLPDNDFKGDILRSMNEIYVPGKPPVDCFAEYILSLVGHMGLAMFNPYDRQFKNLAAPTLWDIINRHTDIRMTLIDAERRLEQSGYHIQVQKSPDTAHLFYHDPARLTIHENSGVYTAGNHRFNEQELLDLISAQPFDFSPDALLRPIMQSAIFPTIAYIGGPAEIAYYAQLMPLFDLFKLTPPQILARPSMTIVESRYTVLREKYNLSFDDFAGDFERTVSDILEKSFPSDIETAIDDYAASVKTGFDTLSERIGQTDREMADICDRAWKKIDYNLNDLRTRLMASHRKRQKTEREKLMRLSDNFLPNKALPERSISAIYFISRYGPGIIDTIYQNMMPAETGHQLLLLTGTNG